MWDKSIIAHSLVASCLLTTTIGCGGVSESDMRRYAIRRSSDETEALQNKPQPQPPAANAAAPPAKHPTGDLSSDDGEPIEAVVQTAHSPMSPEPSLENLSDTQSPPKSPLTPDQSAKRTVANLRRIAEALEKHGREKGYFPARAAFRGERDPQLSWRVTLLPYLGYERLYEMFRLDEPWNSRHNYELLAHIPAVYQSPERFDDHTNYVVPVASNTAFGRNRVVPLSDFEDGPENTVVVVEVDDVAAVPWTAPRELELDFKSLTRKLGTLRGESFFVIWGSGQVGRSLTSASPLDLRAMFTHESGEDFTAGRVDQPLFPASSPLVSGAEARIAAASAHQISASEPAAASAAAAGLHAMAAEFRRRSASSLAESNERDALAWFCAMALVSPPGGEWAQQFRWIPALRRPTSAVRFGVGVQYSGPRDVAALGSTIAARRPAKPSAVWSALTGDFGSHLVQCIKGYAAGSAASDMLISPSAASPPQQPNRQNVSLLSARRANLLEPGITFLGIARASIVRKLAEREAVDILVNVDWRETSRGWSASVELVDLRRDAQLLRLPRLRSTDIEDALSSPLSENPFETTMQAVSEFLETHCQAQELPRQLEPHHAAQRLETLAQRKDENPLFDLAEMRFYYELGLVDAAQLLQAYQAKLDNDAGANLMLGAADVKRRTLKPWLP